jgi:ankyrin repeat protein
LKNGADPNGTSQRDFTVLHYAAKHASLAIIQLLLEAGGNISPSSRSAGVIAHAVEAHSETSDRKPIIQYFINSGADINGLYVQCNGRDRSPLSLWQNQTALHVAVVRGHQPLVEFLLERGADKSIQTKTPASAFKWMSVEELAVKHRRKELVQFFREGTNSTL